MQEPKFKDWLTKLETTTNNKNEYAFCKACNISLVAHKKDLYRHESTERHQKNMRQIAGNSKITDIMTKRGGEATKRAEIKLCGLLAFNNLPFLLMDTLAPLCANIFPDSQIAKDLTLKRTKAAACMKESLGKQFKKQLSAELQKPGCFFSIIMDETTDKSTSKQCAFTIIFFKESVETRFFDMVEVPNGDAETLFNTLKDVIAKKDIPFSNLVGYSSDTTNVMFGENNSVVSRLKIEFPNICCIKCSCHLIHLASSKACLNLPRSIEDLLRNVGAHFSRSACRQQKFQEFQHFFNVQLHKIKLLSNTRWLSMQGCVDRFLEQFDALEAYLTDLVFTDHSRTTEDMLSTMKNKFTRIYLEFMSYVLGILNNFNTLFQTESPLLHRLKPETESLLKTLCSNYIKISVVKNTKNIFQINHENPHSFVEHENMYLGIQATESLNNVKDHVSKEDLFRFYTSCLNFYMKLISEIKKRFTFDDSVFSLLEILDPLRAQSFETKSLSKVLERFPILREYVDTQELDNEWKAHALLNFAEHGLELPIESAEKYWLKVFNLKNTISEILYPNLKVVISFLLILPFSNASVERIFSSLNDIKTDTRVNLDNSTMEALLHTKQGIKLNGGILKFEPDKEMLSTNIWKK